MTQSSAIKHIKARQILDSRGNPTVEVDLFLEDGTLGRASVPSGASTGSREALELRDHDPKLYQGKSVLKAVNFINTFLTPKLIGKNSLEQKELDAFLCNLDGTNDKSKLGANTLLALSLSFAQASSNFLKIPLYRYIRENLKCPFWSLSYSLPSPMMNIINGGAHAANGLDIQEFMIIPKVSTLFSENLRAGVEIFHTLKSLLKKQGASTNVGDEGGFAPDFRESREALDIISTAIEKAGYILNKNIFLSLDVAASEFFEKGFYQFEGKKLSSPQMIEALENLQKSYNFFSIEDGLAESDEEGWKEITKKLSQKTLLIGDDLFVTNPTIFKAGILKKQANAILIKLNQIGTVSETLETLQMALENNYKAIISHRSGETANTFISDLSVATSCGFIKTGSLCRSDRVEKYNQLLRIEEIL